MPRVNLETAVESRQIGQLLLLTVIGENGAITCLVSKVWRFRRSEAPADKLKRVLRSAPWQPTAVSTIKGMAGPYRLFFYSCDCGERKHVHAQRELNAILIESNLDTILEAWNEHCR